MARLEGRRWAGVEGGLTRRDRRPCDYAVYIPDPLVGRKFVLDGDVAADVADAEAALVRLDATAGALADTEALARLLLRAEAVASSRIEGLEVGGRRLLRAQAAHQLGEEPRDVTALEVLGNIEAMLWAVEAVPPGGAISVEIVLEAHRLLLAGTRLAEHAGRTRTVQNWIGGSDYNPCAAAFVPPPHELVDELLSDLAAFCNDDSLPAVAQAAIAHAQFETIHPFVDGNGRTGRALIQLVLRRRGLAPRILPPISLILATWPRDYVAGLTGTRYEGAPDSEEGLAGINRWIALVASACRRAAEDAAALRGAVACAPGLVARAAPDRASRVGGRSAPGRIARRVTTDSHHRIRPDRAVVPGDEPGDRPVRGGRHPQAGHGRAAKPCIRGPRAH